MQKFYNLRTIILFIMVLFAKTSWAQLYDGKYLLFLYSDSIHLVDNVANGKERLVNDTVVYLSEKYYYIQVTDKPIYLFAYDIESKEIQQLTPFNYYYETQYNENTGKYEKAGDYMYGTWTPSTSKISQDIGEKDGWWYKNKLNSYLDEHNHWQYPTVYRVSGSPQPYEWQWWSFEDTGYINFIMEPGLYYLQLSPDGIGLGPVLVWYKLCDIDKDISPYAYYRVTKWHNEKESSTHVNQLGNIISVWGKDWNNTITDYAKAMTDEKIVVGGKYKGYYCTLIGTTPLGNISFEAPGHYSSRWGLKSSESTNPSFGKWYAMEKSGSSVIWNSNDVKETIYLIWDTEGNIVQFITEDMYYSDVAMYLGPTSISTITPSPIVSDKFYSLDGTPVETPQKGKIYIKNGKKVMYK